MSTTFIDSEKLECPICQDLFDNACETSCGHGFCEYCLNKCLEQKPGTCPVCQKNPSPIHPSYTLRSIVESVRKSQNEGKEEEGVGTATVESEKTAGDACHNQKKYAEAIQHYTQALHIASPGDVRNAILYNNRAQCYIKLEQHRRALDDCDEAIRLDPKSIKAYIRKADCLARLGDYEASRQSYLQAARLDTNNAWRDHINKAMLSLPVSGAVPIPNVSPSPRSPMHPPPPPVVPPMHNPFAPPPPPPPHGGRFYPSSRAQYGYPGFQPSFQPRNNNNPNPPNNNNQNSNSANNGHGRRAQESEGCRVQ